MKIIHIYDEHERVFPGEGSGPSLVFHLARQTAVNGHEVTVFERKWKDLPEKESISGINFVRVNLHFCSAISRKEAPQVLIRYPIGLIRFLLDRTEFGLQALRHLTRHHYDVIVLHWPFAAVLIVTLAKKLRRRMVYTEWIVPFPFGRFSPDLYIMRKAQKVIVEHRSVLDALISEWGMNPQRITFIPVFLDMRDFHQSGEVTPDAKINTFKEKYNLKNSSENKNILFVGPLAERKGALLLIKAAGILLHKLNCKVTIIIKTTIVENEYLRRLEALIMEERLVENVRIISDHISNEDMRILYNICDISVAPFLRDGSTSLLEPLACGKPLVAANIEEISETIIHNSTGLLFEPGNETDLANKIKYLIDHPEKMKKLGRNGQKLVEDEYNCISAVKKYEDVYREISRAVNNE